VIASHDPGKEYQYLSKHARNLHATTAHQHHDASQSPYKLEAIMLPVPPLPRLPVFSYAKPNLSVSSAKPARLCVTPASSSVAMVSLYSIKYSLMPQHSQQQQQQQQQAAHQIGSAQLLGLQMDMHRLRICIRCKAVTAEIRLMTFMCWYPWSYDSIQDRTQPNAEPS
jgi:hypothetical protein